jgi:hypothetical protein
MAPVPYSSIAFLDTAVRVSTSVRNNGKYDFQLNSRCATTQGHDPGVGTGVISGGYKGHAHADEAAEYFYSEGFAVVSHRDPAWLNRPGLGPQEPRKSLSTIELAQTTKNFKHACKALGLDPKDASRALHDAKAAAGLGGADNCVFDLNNGDIIFNGESIGNLGG